MKRSLIATLIIGIVVALIVIALHATRAIAGLESALARVLLRHETATHAIGEKSQYVVVSLLALGVAWLCLSRVPQTRMRSLVAVLAIELVGLSWVFSLYRVYFQPLPALLALALGLAGAEA